MKILKLTPQNRDVTITEVDLAGIMHDIGVAHGAAGLDSTLALADKLAGRGDRDFLWRCFNTGVAAGKYARGRNEP